MAVIKLTVYLECSVVQSNRESDIKFYNFKQDKKQRIPPKKIIPSLTTRGHVALCNREESLKKFRINTKFMKCAK